MVPKPDEAVVYNYSSVGVKAIPNRDAFVKSPDQWLEDKKAVDGAEGLWRVYDGIYDLSDFIHKHPGGKFWLECTKGLDVTEHFESHHISTKPEMMLKKFYVRQAKIPRSSPYTFAEDGFYKTLKRNVRKALENIPKDAQRSSHVIMDGIVITSFTLAVLACAYGSAVLGIIAGICFGSVAVASHNYYHQKDSFRMYYSDLCMAPSRDFRIIHVLSHHMYTNTVADMQAYLIEPFMQFFPNTKSVLVKYVSWIYAPLLVWPLLFHYVFITRMGSWIALGESKHLSKADFIPLLLPIAMYFMSGQSLLAAFVMWNFIVAVQAFWFNFIGNATTHFHPDIFMDGDTPRPKHELDWGIAQLDAVSDRHEVTGNLFLVMVTFGDHALHHLFPPVDHAILQHLYPAVEETMKQFNLGIRMTSHLDMWGGYFRQLAKDKPNPNTPDLFVNNPGAKKGLR